MTYHTIDPTETQLIAYAYDSSRFATYLSQVPSITLELISKNTGFMNYLEELSAKAVILLQKKVNQALTELNKTTKELKIHNLENAIHEAERQVEENASSCAFKIAIGVGIGGAALAGGFALYAGWGTTLMCEEGVASLATVGKEITSATITSGSVAKVFSATISGGVISGVPTYYAAKKYYSSAGKKELAQDPKHQGTIRKLQSLQDAQNNEEEGQAEHYAINV